MNMYKLLIFFWITILFILEYFISRVMTGVSRYDFNGNGTIVYIVLVICYLIITTLLGIFVSKNWFYFLVAFVLLTVALPFITIFMLNHFNLK